MVQRNQNFYKLSLEMLLTLNELLFTTRFATSLLSLHAPFKTWQKAGFIFLHSQPCKRDMSGSSKSLSGLASAAEEAAPSCDST